jgi:hypothetical protein
VQFNTRDRLTRFQKAGISLVEKLNKSVIKGSGMKNNDQDSAPLAFAYTN